MTIQIWSTDRIEQLKTSWHAGLSASQIATALGRVTRNAVIGKLHRLGLTENKRTTTTSSSRKRKPHPSPSQPISARHLPSAPRISTPRPISRRATHDFHPLSQRNTAIAVALDLALEQHSIPTNQRLSLSQLIATHAAGPLVIQAILTFSFAEVPHYPHSLIAPITPASPISPPRARRRNQ